MSHHKELCLSAEDARLLATLLEQHMSPDKLLVTQLIERRSCGRHVFTRRTHRALRAASVSLAVAGTLALVATNGALIPRAAHAQPRVRAPMQQVAVVAAKANDTALLADLLSSPTLRQGSIAQRAKANEAALLADLLSSPALRQSTSAQTVAVDQALAESPLAAGTALLIPVAVESVATTAQLPSTYTVQPGDTLSSISLRYYGNGNLWYSIYTANTNVIENPHWIYPGEQLAIPSTGTIAPPAMSSTGATIQGVGNYTVVSGDTLSGIAYNVYGNANRWGEIYRANANIIANPDLIYPDQLLVIPAS